MKAMILAAGRGERMRPLTDTVPKPLLAVRGKSLIVRHIQALRAAGIVEIVINTAHLGDVIEAALGNGARYGVQLRYSREGADASAALETAGGIATALPLLTSGDDAPFFVVNGDVLTDFSFSRAQACAAQLRAGEGWLVMVPNPAQHPRGDFGLHTGKIRYAEPDRTTFTYSGIGVFRPSFFATAKAHEKLKLRPLLDAAIATNALHGELHSGLWEDVGSLERLAALNA